MTYKLFDRREKTYLVDELGIEFATIDYQEAEDCRWEYLQAGNYPEMSLTVIAIHQFDDNGIFKGEVMNMIMN